MSLFQPTNIYPNILNGDAEGTVDATDDLTISWQINGPSAMTGYNLSMFKHGNDSPSYSTEVFVTDGCPAYGRDNLGNVIPFSITIPASEIVDYVNGANYEFSLSICWGTVEDGMPESEEDIVDAPSVVFQARKRPTFSTVSGYSNTITSREWHFDFLQFSTVNIRYFRWVLSLNAGTTAEPVAGQTIYDTGKIYQSGDMTMDYEGFINGQKYVVQCTCCDRYGREVTSDLYPFSCVYDQVNLEFPITVSALTTGSAIHVEWEGANYMYGDVTGDYSISEDNILNLPTTNDSVRWDSQGSRPISFPAPWIVVYKGQLLRSDAILWKIEMESGDPLQLTYTLSTRTLQLAQGSTVLATHSPVDYEATIYTIMYNPLTSTSPMLYTRIEYMTGGLYPATDLYPRGIDTPTPPPLYPSDSTVEAVDKYMDTLTNFTAYSISAISVYGKQKCYFIQEFNSSATYNGNNIMTTLVPGMYNGNTYEPVIADGTNFSATFKNGLNAGSLYYGNSQFAGWAIYRQQAGTGITREIAELPIEAYSFNDYTARTDGTQYIYDIAPIFVADNNYTNGVAMTSGDPFGILNSNYTILETVFNTDMKCYQLLAEYHFGKNVKTGDVSNNNSPNILENFTRYPTVQLSTPNYMSGSVTSLIGTIKVDDNGQVIYSDTRTMRDAIFELSTTSNTLFLKTRKGDIFEIRIANPISISVMEESPTYAQTASINWVQVDDSVDDYVLSYES